MIFQPITHGIHAAKLKQKSRCEGFDSAEKGVLLLEADEMNGDLQNALRRISPSMIFRTQDCQELWLLSSKDPFRLAILHDSLSRLDLEVATRIIRRQWPRAKILVVREDVEFLDDALHDERLLPPVGTEVLLEAANQLLGAARG